VPPCRYMVKSFQMQ